MSEDTNSVVMSLVDCKRQNIQFNVTLLLNNIVQYHSENCIKM